MARKSWEQKVALMWAWVREMAQQGAAHGPASAPSEGTVSRQKRRSVLI